MPHSPSCPAAHDPSSSSEQGDHLQEPSQGLSWIRESSFPPHSCCPAPPGLSCGVQHVPPCLGLVTRQGTPHPARPRGAQPATRTPGGSTQTLRYRCDTTREGRFANHPSAQPGTTYILEPSRGEIPAPWSRGERCRRVQRGQLWGSSEGGTPTCPCGSPKLVLSHWYSQFLSIDDALVLGSSSARSEGSAKSAPNKGPGKSAENLLAFLLLLINRGVFQVHIKKEP